MSSTLPIRKPASMHCPADELMVGDSILTTLNPDFWAAVKSVDLHPGRGDQPEVVVLVNHVLWFRPDDLVECRPCRAHIARFWETQVREAQGRHPSNPTQAA